MIVLSHPLGNVEDVVRRLRLVREHHRVLIAIEPAQVKLHRLDERGDADLAGLEDDDPDRPIEHGLQEHDGEQHTLCAIRYQRDDLLMSVTDEALSILEPRPETREPHEHGVGVAGLLSVLTGVQQTGTDDLLGSALDVIAVHTSHCKPIKLRTHTAKVPGHPRHPGRRMWTTNQMPPPHGLRERLVRNGAERDHDGRLHFVKRLL